MMKLDLLKLRKAAGLSQRELADRLAVQPSFLSAIENGRSRFPDDKMEKLMEIVELEDLSDYMVEESEERPNVVAPHTHTHSHTATDAIAELLNHIHAQAHKYEHDDVNRSSEMEERINFLTKRNDRLSDRVDNLRDEVDSLREENFRLKELLTRNGIPY